MHEDSSGGANWRPTGISGLNACMTGSCQGVHEVGIGVTDPQGALHHWEHFGYRPGATGSLDRAAALALYGVDSPLRAWRLSHGAADKGLVRLMTWEESTGPGLEMAPLRTPGNRWSVQKTDDLLTVWTHAEVARRQGHRISVLGPVLNARSAVPIAQQRPFAAAVPAAYNLQFFQPLFQQVVMQRQHIDVRRLGTIAEASLFRTSEICHVGLVVYTTDVRPFDFYEHALGLWRTTQHRFPYDPDSPASEMFALRPGEAFTEIDFDDPRARQDPSCSLAGRLRVFAVESQSPRTQVLDASPGQLGYSLYSVRTGDIRALRKAVIDGGAARVTPVLENEFGEPAFAFRAPDGYAWTAVGNPGS
jgi:hypothetical protein